MYARLLAEGRREEARRVAGGVAALLGVVVAVLVAIGVTIAPLLVDVFAPGWDEPKRALTRKLVRILFPGTGLLVWSAWCLGILNSHRRFLLSYAAPVVWNAAIIAATLLAPAGAPAESIVVWTAWGAVAGGLLQLLVQLPAARAAAGGVLTRPSRSDPGIRSVLSGLGPALLSRGVVQVSAYVDAVLVSFLGTSAAAGLASAQLLYTLPVSLFGVSVAAAELPSLAAEAGSTGAGPAALRERLERGLVQIAYFVIPSAVASLALGHVIAGAVFETGAFTRADSRYVWGILAGSAVGLLAGTSARLCSSAWFALHDTRTPFRYASARVGTTILLGSLGALVVPGLLGLDPRWGAVGITLAGAIAATIEFFLLRRGLDRRLGAARLPAGLAVRLWGAAIAGAAAGWGALLLTRERLGPVLTALLVLAPFGLVYLGLTWWLRVPFARELFARLRTAR